MTDLHVVGVHGVRQRDTNAIKLADDWNQALARGIAVHAGSHAVVPVVTAPYYGDVFRRGRLKLGEDEVSDFATTDEEELDYILGALEVHSPPVPGQQLSAGTLGMPPRMNPRLVRAIARVDRRCGNGAGRLVFSRISEMYGYFKDKDKAEQIRTRVREAVEQTGTPLIIAHSLGSVVVYDMFQRGQIPAPAAGTGVTQLITCGSPLAWMPVQRKLGLTATAGLRLPMGVAWLNVYDPRDPVTAGVGLVALAPELIDAPVDNRNDPHAADRYLEQKAVALGVQAALELFAPPEL
ncbi:hypothetical protein [Embleya sp. MST-111070]|uniref:hypothetical protein n=1 Tax=Embleya sp. MST-111070 TaxID=3398231 RepID=UPI003F73BC91